MSLKASSWLREQQENHFNMAQGATDSSFCFLQIVHTESFSRHQTHEIQRQGKETGLLPSWAVHTHGGKITATQTTVKLWVWQRRNLKPEKHVSFWTHWGWVAFSRKTGKETGCLYGQAAQSYQWMKAKVFFQQDSRDMRQKMTESR